MSGLLTRKVALVTGGSTGIGRASCLAFARGGARVVVADINAEAGKHTVQPDLAGGRWLHHPMSERRRPV